MLLNVERNHESSALLTLSRALLYCEQPAAKHRILFNRLRVPEFGLFIFFCMLNDCEHATESHHRAHGFMESRSTHGHQVNSQYSTISAPRANTAIKNVPLLFVHIRDPSQFLP